MPGQPSPLERRLANPRERARLREEMIVNLRRRGGADTMQISRFAPDTSLEGRRLSDLASERGAEPVDIALELLDEGGAGLISFNMNEDDIAHIMSQDFTMTSSDGGLVAIGEGKPHPRFYGTYPRKIARYVRERGVVGLAHAIRSMTSLPATVFGIVDRGQLRVGAWADVVVFDLETVRDRATYQDPHQLAEGAVHVLVNGKITGPGVLAGRVLRPGE
jgi:N-acyl-D-amino-acid deacylase